MANVNIKFNGKDFLLSCEDGQEDHLEELAANLNNKFEKLKNDLGNIGENKLLLITSIKLIDEHFDLKHRINNQKNKLDDIANRFKELKSLAINYKDLKETEIEKLNDELTKLKTNIDKTNSMYEDMLDKTSESLEKIIKRAESSSKVQ